MMTKARELDAARCWHIDVNRPAVVRPAPCIAEPAVSGNPCYAYNLMRSAQITAISVAQNGQCLMLIQPTITQCVEKPLRRPMRNTAFNLPGYLGKTHTLRILIPPTAVFHIQYTFISHYRSPRPTMLHDTGSTIADELSVYIDTLPADLEYTTQSKTPAEALFSLLAKQAQLAELKSVAIVTVNFP